MKEQQDERKKANIEDLAATLEYYKLKSKKCIKKSPYNTHHLFFLKGLWS